MHALLMEEPNGGVGLNVRHNDSASIHFLSALRSKLICGLFLRRHMDCFDRLLNELSLDGMLCVVRILLWHLHFMVLHDRGNVNSWTYFVLPCLYRVCLTSVISNFIIINLLIRIILRCLFFILFFILFFFIFNVENPFEEIYSSIFNSFEKLVNIVVFFLFFSLLILMEENLTSLKIDFVPLYDLGYVLSHVLNLREPFQKWNHL
jgi:hypothetical protein